MKKIVVLLIIFVSFLTVSLAHSGRTDGYGGHYNRSTGTYHYHNGSYSGEYTAPIEEGGSNIYEIDKEEALDEFIFTDTDNANTEELQEKNQKLEEKTFEMEKNQEELNQQINNLEEDKKGLHYVYITIIAIMGFIIYQGIRRQNKTEEQIQQYKEIEETIRKQLGTINVRDTLEEVKKFYNNQREVENKEDG